VEVERENSVKAEFEEMLQGLKRFLQMPVKVAKAKVIGRKQREAELFDGLSAAARRSKGGKLEKKEVILERKECEAEAKS
jgi:hypothetical protein